MKTTLPVITLYQPWATWIMRGWKTIETRTHDRFKSLNGQTILIHAGKKTDDSAAAFFNPYLTKEQILFNPDEVINGFILGQARVYNFRKLTPPDAKWALIECETGRWGLEMDSIVKFEKPIEVKGEMGIWYFDLATMEKVRRPTKRAETLNNLFGL